MKIICTYAVYFKQGDREGVVHIASDVPIYSMLEYCRSWIKNITRIEKEK